MIRRLPNLAFWRGRRVLVTGHTGFKGGWLCLWLHEMGARIAGYAFAPPPGPNLFTACDIESFLQHNLGDIDNLAHLIDIANDFVPEIVFHLAAQPLVRASYAAPLATFQTNVIGTLNVLAAAAPHAAAAVIVTSDKVYAEPAPAAGYTETDRLGGADPYSASKACAELAVRGLSLPLTCAAATVRSGNVIGGGDWAQDRLVADFLRAMEAGRRLSLRNPDAIRPWQHVLDPLCGYLLAAEHLHTHRTARVPAWNFGPAAASEIPVRDLAAKLCRLWGGNAGYDIHPTLHAPHEAATLRLDAAKATTELGWHPAWALDEALARTVAWAREFTPGAAMRNFTRHQIAAYLAA